MPNIFWMGRPTKFKLGTQMEHEEPYQRIFFTKIRNIQFLHWQIFIHCQLQPGNCAEDPSDEYSPYVN